MEYPNVVGGTYDCDVLKMEKNHVDCMQLLTGATSCRSIIFLYTDTTCEMTPCLKWCSKLRTI